jgi:hypothetical protein
MLFSLSVIFGFSETQRKSLDIGIEQKFQHSELVKHKSQILKKTPRSESTSELDYFCGQVVPVPGNRTEIYCASCEVRTEFIYVM